MSLYTAMSETAANFLTRVSYRVSVYSCSLLRCPSCSGPEQGGRGGTFSISARVIKPCGQITMRTRACANCIRKFTARMQVLRIDNIGILHAYILPIVFRDFGRHSGNVFPGHAELSLLFQEQLSRAHRSLFDRRQLSAHTGAHLVRMYCTRSCTQSQTSYV